MFQFCDQIWKNRGDSSQLKPPRIIWYVRRCIAHFWLPNVWYYFNFGWDTFVPKFTMAIYIDISCFKHTESSFIWVDFLEGRCKKTKTKTKKPTKTCFSHCFIQMTFLELYHFSRDQLNWVLLIWNSKNIRNWKLHFLYQQCLIYYQT